MLLFAAEWKYASMIKYFEFLVTELGKASFMIFIGVLMFDNERLVDLCASLILSGLGLINLAIYCLTKSKKVKKQESEEERESLLNINSDDDMETHSEKQKRHLMGSEDKWAHERRSVLTVEASQRHSIDHIDYEDPNAIEKVEEAGEAKLKMRDGGTTL